MNLILFGAPEQRRVKRHLGGGGFGGVGFAVVDIAIAPCTTWPCRFEALAATDEFRDWYEDVIDDRVARG